MSKLMISDTRDGPDDPGCKKEQNISFFLILICPYVIDVALAFHHYRLSTIFVIYQKGLTEGFAIETERQK